MSSTVVHVIILNYQTPELTRQCLESVARQRGEFGDGALRVTLVDNASPDGSGAALRATIAARDWSDWVDFLGLDENRGFAAGNNAALAAGPAGEFVLFLNSDTIVHDGCLRHCVEAMRREPGVGALTCRLLNQDGSIQNSVRRFPTPLRTMAASLGLPWKLPRLFGWANGEDPGWDRATERRDVEWIGGAFLLVRGAVLERVGGFDEDFFFYGEDIELCHRIHRAGYVCRHEPGAATTHLGGGSSDPTVMPAARQDDHRRAARDLVQRKLYGRWATVLLFVIERAVAKIRCLKSVAGPPSLAEDTRAGPVNKTD